MSVANFTPLGFARCLQRAMHDLGVPPDNSLVFGSAVMKLHDLRQDIGDVDAFVPPWVYARLRQIRGVWTEQRPREDDPPLLESTWGRHGVEFTINVFHAWTSRDVWCDVPEAWLRAERVHGILVVPLDIVARWKHDSLQAMAALGIRQEKHEHDLHALSAAGVRW